MIDVADFNDADKLGKGKEMVDRLSNLVAIFDNPALDFRGNRAEGDDLLGDAYEYLMRHFATESGKSKGQFYTPAEVSRIMAKVIGIGAAPRADQTIYDPTCGSGSLLLKGARRGKRARLDLALYGQEMDNATSALARMNMILHDCPTAEIWKDNVLSTPHFKQPDGSLKTFDFVVANPPFSFKAWSNGFNPAEDEFNRFAYGIPPAKNGDYAFLLHILTSLKSTGKGAVNLPHGVLFRGGAEADIRRKIVRRGYIKGIIGLPPNLFYGTGIPACIIVLDKENAAARKGIFMIDASKGFIKDGNKNRLRAQDIHKIVDVFTRQVEIPRYSRMVPLAEISDPRTTSTSISRATSTAPSRRTCRTSTAHLRGGIPNRDIDALERYWQVFPVGARPRCSIPQTAPATASSRCRSRTSRPPSSTTRNSPPSSNRSQPSLRTGSKANVPRLEGIAVGDKPKALIETLSEDLLETFEKAPLLEAYDVYQHLMDYWAETMQDDVYMIVSDGWREAAKPRQLIEDKERKNKEQADFTIGKLKYRAELVPTTLIVSRYFTAERAAIEALEARVASIEQKMEEFRDEHGGEEGLLAEVIDDGKISKTAVTARLKEIKHDSDADEERNALQHYLALMDKESDTTRQMKDATTALDAKIAAKYGNLTEDEIKTLVVDDKWLVTISAAIQSDLARVSQALTGRVKQLAERYATPLPKLTAELASLTARVDEHLKRCSSSSPRTRLPGFHSDWQETPQITDEFLFVSPVDLVSVSTLPTQRRCSPKRIFYSRPFPQGIGFGLHWIDYREMRNRIRNANMQTDEIDALDQSERETSEFFATR